LAAGGEEWSRTYSARRHWSTDREWWHSGDLGHQSEADDMKDEVEAMVEQAVAEMRVLGEQKVAEAVAEYSALVQSRMAILLAAMEVELRRAVAKAA
jgi:hypothetical protein